jgi:hypothetical protein
VELEPVVDLDRYRDSRTPLAASPVAAMMRKDRAAPVEAAAIND